MGMPPALRAKPLIEVLNVKPGVSLLLIFASLPDYSQNQTAVYDAQHLLSVVGDGGLLAPTHFLAKKNLRTEGLVQNILMDE
jgi:hypothetical protein